MSELEARKPEIKSEAFMVVVPGENGSPVCEKVLHRRLVEKSLIVGDELLAAFDGLEAVGPQFAHYSLKDMVIVDPSTPSAYEYIRLQGGKVSCCHIVDNGEVPVVNVAQDIPLGSFMLELPADGEVDYSLQGQLSSQARDFDVRSQPHRAVELLERARQAVKEVKPEAIIPVRKRRRIGQRLLDSIR